MDVTELLNKSEREAEEKAKEKGPRKEEEGPFRFGYPDKTFISSSSSPLPTTSRLFDEPSFPLSNNSFFARLSLSTFFLLPLLLFEKLGKHDTD